MNLVEYYPKTTFDEAEYFKVAVKTTGGTKFREHRYKWFNSVLFKEAKEDLVFSLYDKWDDLSKEVKGNLGEWKHLRLDGVEANEHCSVDNGLRINFKGYRKAYPDEIKLYDQLQDQVGNITEHKKQAAKAEVDDAKEAYERLLVRFNNTYGAAYVETLG